MFVNECSIGNKGEKTTEAGNLMFLVFYQGAGGAPTGMYIRSSERLAPLGTRQRCDRE